jgi:hypothetical protein
MKKKIQRKIIRGKKVTKKKIVKHSKEIVRRKHLIKMFLMTVIIIAMGSVIFSKELGRAFSVVHDFFVAEKEINLELKNKIEKLTEGYPIKDMASEIAKQDEQVAAFLVAIAKKESAWGKRTPKLKGEECYNYWGFRKKRLLMGSGGHTCFDSPEDAVKTVANRIENLVAKGIDTPQEMVLWKCGNCTGPARVGAGKWIADVGLYYNKIME